VTPLLATERLLLREWRDSDLAPYAALNADPVVMEHFPSTLTSEQSDDMVRRIRANWDVNDVGLWAAERRDTGEFIGFIGLAVPSWHTDFTPCVEVGWRLAKEHWGLGFAPEGARAALGYGFEHLDLPGDEIVSFTTTKNHNSQRVMQKIGMRRDPARDFDHPMTPGWHGQAHVLYCISRAEWQAGRATSVAR
jgi:RimJ/RimL family protein N-acetyltransferase